MIFVLAPLIIGIVSPPDVTPDPRLSWLTMETEHFLIHFSVHGKVSEERVDFIRRIAQIAEEVRNTVLKETGRAPQDKVHIVVTDLVDDHNGWAVPFPVNTITIFTSPPRVFKFCDDDWLRTLLLHEFSHILQMEQCRGVPAFFRSIAGRVVLPNALLPAWLLEGYAVYNESRFSGGGRLRSAEWQGMLLVAAQGNGLLSIDRCSGYDLQRYPGGLAPYLYGANFLGFLARNEGDSIWDKFNHQHSGQVPFFINSAARTVLGRTFPRLWRVWQESLFSQLDVVQRGRIDFSATPINILVDNEFAISSPCWSRNGAEVYYIAAGEREKTAIKALNLGARTVRTVYRGNITGSIALSPDGRELVFSEWLVSGPGYVRSDIFLYNLETGKKRRLTFNERAYDPDFSPDGAVIVYVSKSLGQSNLILMDIKTGEKRQLTDNQDNCVYHRPRFSPGGRLIAVGVWRPGGYGDIEVIDRETGWVLSITSDRACDIFPVWSRTGKFLFFVSDRSGLYNLYAYGVENQLLYRCTDVVGGVFEPAISPDNRKIALVLLASQGKELGLMELKGKEWQRAESFIDRYPPFEPVSVSPEYQLYHYYPLATLKLGFWLPWLNIFEEQELGVYTLGWDVLQFNRYQATAGYNFTGRTPFLRVWYELRRFWPDLELRSEITTVRQEIAAGANAPVYGNDWVQNFRIGFVARHNDIWRTSLNCAWGFSNAQTYRFCVAPVSGREMCVIADGAARAIYGESDRIRFAGYWYEYFSVPPATWGLKFKTAIGRAFGDSSVARAFRLSSTSGLFRIRGYKDELPSGSNAGLLGIEFHTPLFWVERGAGVAPLFFRNINAATFCEIGFAVNKLNEVSTDWRGGVGCELQSDFTIAYYVPLKLTLGIALGLNPGFSHQLYLNVSSDLLNAIVNPATFLIPSRLSR